MLRHACVASFHLEAQGIHVACGHEKGTDLRVGASVGGDARRGEIGVSREVRACGIRKTAEAGVLAAQRSEAGHREHEHARCPCDPNHGDSVLPSRGGRNVAMFRRGQGGASMPRVTRGSLESLSARNAELSEDEVLVQESVRRFVRERYLPRARELYEREEFPRELIPEMAELGLLGAGLSGYGCAGMSPVAYGLVLEELEYGDSGLRSFVSVQGSLAMTAIHAFGTEAQKQRYLPEIAAGRLVGCFGLSEPDSGSDPASMRTRARSDGAEYVLTGTKTWITNAPFADLAVVWAKVDGGEAESIRGFIVERGTAGFETARIGGKMSLRSSDTGEITLGECRVPASQALVHKPGLGAALRCLGEARFGISWGAVGAARACFDCAESYA